MAWQRNDDLLRDQISQDLFVAKAWYDTSRFSFKIVKTNIICFMCDVQQGVRLRNEELQARAENKFLGLRIAANTPNLRYPIPCQNLLTAIFILQEKVVRAIANNESA